MYPSEVLGVDTAVAQYSVGLGGIYLNQHTQTHHNFIHSRSIVEYLPPSACLIVASGELKVKIVHF